MDINVDNEKKMVGFWLSQDEQRDAALMERLKPQYKQYADKKYLVAVFRSGTCDLCETTAALLCSNRQRLAQREAEAEHRQGIAQQPGGRSGV